MVYENIKGVLAYQTVKEKTLQVILGIESEDRLDLITFEKTTVNLKSYICDCFSEYETNVKINEHVDAALIELTSEGKIADV